MSKWTGGKHNGFKSPCSYVAHVILTHISLSKTSHLDKPQNGIMEIQIPPPHLRQITRQKVGMDKPLAEKKKRWE